MPGAGPSAGGAGGTGIGGAGGAGGAGNAGGSQRGCLMPLIIGFIFILLIASGAFLKLEAIWILADIVNGLMAIPNLIALLALSGVIVAETNKYLSRRPDEE